MPMSVSGGRSGSSAVPPVPNVASGVPAAVNFRTVGRVSSAQPTSSPPSAVATAVYDWIMNPGVAVDSTATPPLPKVGSTAPAAVSRLATSPVAVPRTRISPLSAAGTSAGAADQYGTGSLRVARPPSPKPVSSSPAGVNTSTLAPPAFAWPTATDPSARTASDAGPPAHPPPPQVVKTGPPTGYWAGGSSGTATPAAGNPAATDPSAASR